MSESVGDTLGRVYHVSVCSTWHILNTWEATSSATLRFGFTVKCVRNDVNFSDLSEICQVSGRCPVDRGLKATQWRESHHPPWKQLWHSPWFCLEGGRGTLLKASQGKSMWVREHHLLVSTHTRRHITFTPCNTGDTYSITTHNIIATITNFTITMASCIASWGNAWAFSVAGTSHHGNVLKGSEKKERSWFQG